MFVVFDLDGTIANDDHRQHYLYRAAGPDWGSYFDACAGDPVIAPVAKLTATLHRDPSWTRLEIWTGRPESVRSVTERWLKEAGVRYDALRMRADGDYRTNREYKGDLVQQHGRPDLVFEDRLPAVRWWRSMGIVCLAVAENDY